ncbi:MAG: glycosyl transferase [Flavobacteriaceae bacterium]|nr:glycosyl transferase [Flavobacteriaceae bacterium]
MKKTLKLVSIVLLSIVLMATAGYFVFRNSVLEWAINKAKTKFQTKYHARLNIGSAAISGWIDVGLKDICIVPENGDTVVKVANVNTSFKLFKLLFGKIQFSHLNISDGAVSLVKYDSASSNYAAFLRSKKKETEEPETKINLARQVYKLVNAAFEQVPTDLQVSNFFISHTTGDRKYIVSVRKMTLQSEQLLTEIAIETPSGKQQWVLRGPFDPANMTGDINICSADRSRMTLPWLDTKLGMLLGANDVQLKLTAVEMDGDQLSIKCSAAFKNLLLNHPRLADHDVTVDNGSGNFHFLLGENFVALDSSSQLTLNKIVCYPYIRFQRSPVKEYELKLRTDKMAAQDFFNSLPDGMFDGLTGIQTEGFLTYRMSAFLNDTDVWNNRFESDMERDNFKIRSWGTAYLPKIGGPFTYTPYEYGRPQRPIDISLGNQYFTEYNEISPFVRGTVLTSEDPSFMWHRGFVMDAVRQSIAHNYRTKRFARGASTISMQLVKNIFLSRKKTLTRKFEEMLLVWLMENSGVCSKQRMFEVYLNIIEWGPGIYGIGEAADFYFKKSPSQITLPEAIFLSSIIPQPKAFAWRFDDSTGDIRPRLGGYFRQISRLMTVQNLITPEDTVGLLPSVKLTGPAKQYLKKYKNQPEPEEEPELPEIGEGKME